MAPPRRKAEGWPRKERILRPRYAHRERRKRPDIRRRVHSHEPINVQQLVYSLLNADEYNQALRENEAYNDDRFHGKYRNVREASYDDSMVRDSSVTIDDSDYTKSTGTSVAGMSMVMDAANSSAASSSRNSTISNMSVEPIVLAKKSIDNTRALLKKKSLVQVINNYIRAGIEEGKRRAKKYICRALSFGMKCGYLMPADPQGQMIRVSPALIESKKSDIEARHRRRSARRGEDHRFIYDKEYRKPTPPWKRSQKPYREPTPKPEMPPKKRRKISDTKELDMNQTASGTKKKVGTRGRRGRGKKKATRKKSDEDQRKARRKRSSQKQETVKKARESKTRRGKSPRTKRDEKENSRRKGRHSDDEDNVKFSDDEEEDNIMPTGHRKSATNRKDFSQHDGMPNGLPVREHEEVLEVRNDDNVQNNNVDNVN